MVEIRTRFTGMTYMATVRGEKHTASCTIDARHAAEALARKLSLAPGLLQEQPDLLNPRERTTFTHPGDLLEEAGDAPAL